MKDAMAKLPEVSISLERPQEGKINQVSRRARNASLKETKTW